MRNYQPYHLLWITLVMLLSASHLMAGQDKALEAQYRALKQRYETLREQGRDMNPYVNLVRKVERARKRRQKTQLYEAMQQLERAFPPLIRTSTKAVVTSAFSTPLDDMPCGASGEFALSRLAYAQRAYALLLQYRGSDQYIGLEGAVGRNQEQFSDVAVQREAIWVLLRAIKEENPTTVDAVVRAMEYAFARQDARGFFNNGHGVQAREAVGVDAFFLQGYARIYCLLNQTPFDTEYRARLDVFKPNVRQALQWLSTNTEELFRQDRNATNRLFFDGLAFLLNGYLLQAPDFIATGQTFVRTGLQGQRADGTFNEHGGYDSSYQAVSILNLSLLWAYAQDEAFKQELFTALVSATTWMRGRIRADGKVEVNGNTRTGLGQEALFGKVKEVNYAEVVLSLYYAAAVTSDPSLVALANKVVEYVAKEKR